MSSISLHIEFFDELMFIIYKIQCPKKIYLMYINDDNTAWQQYKPALIGALDVSGYGGIYGQGRAAYSD